MKYIDRDGDVWVDASNGQVRCTDGDSLWERSDAEERWGPLRPADGLPADGDTRKAIRAELAVVLQEMADAAYDEYRWQEGVDADVCYRVHALFEGKAKALREETS